MFELDSTADTGGAARVGGWTLLTAVCLMLFSLVHNPCSTTIYTIWKETGSVKWTTVSALLPLFMGFLLCFVVAQTWRLVADDAAGRAAAVVAGARRALRSRGVGAADRRTW